MNVIPKMKTVGLLVLISTFVFTQVALAQESASRDDEPPKGYIAITFGPTLTTGDFGDNNWDNDSASFATNGYNYSIVEFGYKFLKNFGLYGSIKGSVIPVDVQALADGFAGEYGGEFKVTSTRYGYGGLFVGPFLSFPTKYVDIDLKFAPGLTFANSPEITITRDAETAGQSSAVGAGLAINAGAALRIHVSKKFSIVAEATYYLSQPAFEIEVYDTQNNYQTVSASQRMTMYNFSFGFAYRLF